MKTLLTWTVCILVALAGKSTACSSFAVYGDEPVYGMNFDYERFPMKFVIAEQNGMKVFHLMFERPVGGEHIWVSTASMNEKGVFASCQEEHPAQKPVPPQPDDLFVHQLYNIASLASATADVKAACLEKRLVQIPDVSIHIMVADPTGEAAIFEAGEQGAEIIPITGKAMVMTNFPNRDMHGHFYTRATGVGSNRFKIGHKEIRRHHYNLNPEQAMALLQKMNNQNPAYPTVCSMVFLPERNEIRASVFGDYNKSFRIHLSGQKLDTGKGFQEKQTFSLGDRGIMLTDLKKL